MKKYSAVQKTALRKNKRSLKERRRKTVMQSENNNFIKSICAAVLAVLIAVQVIYIVKLSGEESELKRSFSMGNAVSENGSSGNETGGVTETPIPSENVKTPEPVEKKVIVLDAGHGKSSSLMSAEEKKDYGWVQNSSGDWGEWRHWKSGTVWEDCHGSGCNGQAPENGGCWYPISNGDRGEETEINMRNTLAAKKYLENNGFTVRMARESNDENPSLTMRLRKCYPNSDISAVPDAIAYVCIHSNAGGGRGSAYLALGSGYDHAYHSENYVREGNELGKMINDRITAQTSLSAYSDGRYDGQPDLILFHKSPVPVAYLEIGFFDNSSDAAILESECDAIGKAIAEGIMDYVGAKSI